MPTLIITPALLIPNGSADKASAPLRTFLQLAPDAQEGAKPNDIK
jgi:hypothetical protein